MISSTFVFIFTLLSLSLFSSNISSFVEVVVVSLPFFITVLVVVTIFFFVIIWGISFIIIFDSLFDEDTSVALSYNESIFDIWSLIGWSIIFLLSIESGDIFFNSEEIEFMSWEGFSGLGIDSVVSLGEDCMFPEFSALIF